MLLTYYPSGRGFGLAQHPNGADLATRGPLTPDHVNPERPWPAIDVLTRRTAERGLELRERLTIYPEYAMAAQR